MLSFLLDPDDAGIGQITLTEAETLRRIANEDHARTLMTWVFVAFCGVALVAVLVVWVMGGFSK